MGAEPNALAAILGCEVNQRHIESLYESDARAYGELPAGEQRSKDEMCAKVMHELQVPYTELHSDAITHTT